MGGVELGGVGRGEEGQPHPRQRPQRLEVPLISQGRVCEGASVGQALQILTGRREAVLGWVPELWARESCNAKGGKTESLGPSGRLKGAYHRTPLSPKWAAAGGGLLRDSASLRLRPQPSVPGLSEVRERVAVGREALSGLRTLAVPEWHEEETEIQSLTRDHRAVQHSPR